MANGAPYADLKGTTLEGSFGPASAMRAAIAAYTPNIPWARFGCDTAVRLNGEGTSAATPQVAAAVALWFEKYKDVLPRDWRRVEAVRNALFTTARKGNDRALRQRHAAARRPRSASNRCSACRKAAKSTHSFAFLRLITGLGLVEPPPREQMFNLELAQRWLVNDELQKIVPDPESVTTLRRHRLQRVMEAVIEDGAPRWRCASTCRALPGRRGPVGAAHVPERRSRPGKAVACAAPPPVPTPSFRKLRAFAMDPPSPRSSTTAGSRATRSGSTPPAQRGDLVVDAGRTSKRPGRRVPRHRRRGRGAPKPNRYTPVDLERSAAAGAGRLGAVGRQPAVPPADGLRGGDEDHRALRAGARPPGALACTTDRRTPSTTAVRPAAHRPAARAVAQANAFYSPRGGRAAVRLLRRRADDPGDHMPGSRVYSCLSHDIIAHETTHAILDGMHRRFNEPTNLDVLAFHEGFADIVALLQHFTIPRFSSRRSAARAATSRRSRCSAAWPCSSADASGRRRSARRHRQGGERRAGSGLSPIPRSSHAG